MNLLLDPDSIDDFAESQSYKVCVLQKPEKALSQVVLCISAFVNM